MGWAAEIMPNSSLTRIRTWRLPDEVLVVIFDDVERLVSPVSNLRGTATDSQAQTDLVNLACKTVLVVIFWSYDVQTPPSIYGSSFMALTSICTAPLKA